MTSNTYPIVGIKDGIGADGSRPLRYEITKFIDPAHNPYAKDQLNLFLLAMAKVQAMPSSERLSWFQIGGIHGQPFVAWDNSNSTVQPGDRRWLGYCTHGSILFPTWHRLYSALLEQAVHECMKKVLAEFPSQQQAILKPAVDHWRYPYWDWALANSSGQLVIPELMRVAKVNVMTPTGAAMIDNPMYRYALPIDAHGKIDGITDVVNNRGVVFPFSRAPFTVRHPHKYNPEVDLKEQETWAQGKSDDNAVEVSLNSASGGGKQLVAQVYQLFSMMRSYPPFSNSGWTGTGRITDYRSLENVHNGMHVFIGGMTSGHMSLTNVASFDPWFWMHHGNIERLVSIFQALNPADYKDWPQDDWLSKTKEPWFEGQESRDGTFTRPRGQNEQPTSPLAPFHKDTRGTVWDSNGCRSINTFGYSFEELQDWKPKYRTDGRLNVPLFCKDIRASLVQKYGWALPSRDAVRRIALGAQTDEPQGVHSRLAVNDNQFTEYVVNVRVDRFAYEGQTFVVDIFLDDIPADVAEWENVEKLAVVTIFGGDQLIRGECSNCASQAEGEETSLVTGQVSITASLIELIESKKSSRGDVLKTLDKDEVGRYLKTHMFWRVAKLGNEEFDIHDIPSLKVSVAVAKATLPESDDEFISYGEFELLNEPTQGRPAGYDCDHDTI